MIAACSIILAINIFERDNNIFERDNNIFERDDNIFESYNKVSSGFFNNC